MSGRSSRRRSYPKPIRSITPAAKFSVTASDTRTSSRQQLLAPLGAQVQGDAELLDVVVVEPGAAVGTAVVVEYGATPRTMSHRPRVTGSSMRMTWAPNVASTRVAPAPASWPGEVADADVVQRAARRATRCPSPC